MATKLSCPYCYRSFVEKSIAFRCSGRPSGNGKRCPTQTDRVLNSRMGDSQPKYPAFTADGRKLQATCPACAEVTNHRLCPECHSLLPVHFGQVDGRLIALVGAKETGKTVYMTVLLHELLHEVGRRFGASVMGADDDTRRRFAEEYEDVLYEKREVHGTTRTAAATQGGRQPLVFSFSRPTRRAGRERIERSLLSFFDTAGEDLISADSVDQNLRYLNSADGIILLLDPLQMKGARPLANADAVLPHEAGANDLPANILSRITDLLHQGLGTGRGQRINKPIAVAFAKIDALTDTLSADSPLRYDGPDEPYFDEADSLDVHEHVRKLLVRWQGGQLEDALATNFTRYRFFGVSALGDSPVVDAQTNSERISEHGIRPLRVADPFLWLLREFNTIPTKQRA